MCKNLTGNYWLCLAVSLVFILGLAPQSRAEDLDLACVFNRLNAEGTIVISTLDGQKTFVHNEARAKTELLPASTFKIPNTLIALERGAVASGTEIIKWDGQIRGMDAWNRDQSIETAFPVSCVWFYQELAKRVGLNAYRDDLRRIHYGNENVGPELTTFWLEGDLRISAYQQVDFLRKLVLRQLPFKDASYDLLKRIMVIERAESYTISGKTGWATKTDSPVGWIVGYVEAKNGVSLFATNIVMTKIEEAPKRMRITIEALKAKGLI